MNQRIDELIGRIRTLEEELEAELKKRRPCPSNRR